MTLLTTAELRRQIETDLPDPVLHRILASAEAQIIDVAGVHPTSAITEYLDWDGYPSGKTIRLWTNRRIGSITEIRERETITAATTTLSANDYRRHGAREIIRLPDGDNPRVRWAPYVEIDYVPEDDLAIRKQVQVQLAQLAISYTGLQGEKYGDVDFSHGPLANEADKVRAILAPLFRKRWPVV